MHIFNRLVSILDKRVAAQTDWEKVNRIASTAGTEFEYQWLIATLRPIENLKCGATEIAGKAEY